MKTPNELQHLIIGGTAKAATSSLFNYLNAHPQVCGSRIKETYFFSQNYSDDLELDLARYAAYFSPGPDARVLFEASPNYLASRENVAPRIKRLIPDVKLLFVLRNPVDRLYSHFNFAKGKLDLPRQMSFEDFVECCEAYNGGEIDQLQTRVAEKDLRALEMGKYGKYLQNFYAEFDRSSILVIFFDDLNTDPLGKLGDICEFIGVDPSYYRDFEMSRANVTFASRLAPLHRIAMLGNRLLEPVLRHRPGLKTKLVRLYQLLNRDTRRVEPMKQETRNKLQHYYLSSNALLKDLLDNRQLPKWADVGERAGT